MPRISGHLAPLPWQKPERVCDHRPVRIRFPSAAFTPEVAEFADEIREAFLDMAPRMAAESLAGECLPALDVDETDDEVDIVVDVPGVDPASVRVIAKGQSILIVGEKAARSPRAESSFHLVERDFGRFVRTVRVGRAFDTGQA